MSSHHHHDHSAHGHEGHSHSAKGIPKKRLLQAMGFSLVITVAQIIGGIISGSLALMSDALHTATDAIALIVSYIAVKLGEKPRTDRHTFGLKRAEIVAAVLNAGVLIGISIWLMYEAILRYITPEEVEGGIMVGVATVGLVANIINSFLLHKGAKDNINMRSAYLHVLSDAVVSVGVILGGIAIMFFKVTWIDPTLTLIISIWLIRESWGIVGEALQIIMMASPRGINLKDVEKSVVEIDGVCGIHHIHLWQLNDQSVHFEAHVEVEDKLVSNTACIIDAIEDRLHDDYSITHVTVQLEAGRCEETKRISEN
ncbi:cation diffusion facilitator family transporter [Rubellicoccus peritrichatus]|uniref:Cation diffusion facilitator family transporter n=1 Tax=Rubellicoccus peritrichatus TaxID=3080537 RepID=A0AAQ3QSX4_9BACT|nr:cation diffusion facilitator family transporter [Puniceicoccus sp. CR14]WOO40681.1 cation diffusion facilitator family transporter [Puniceicoccus sp. CR14]